MPQDYTDALRINREAAKRGDRGAQYHLGVMFGLGLGVPQDYAEAFKWYRKAAAAGDPRAQNNLGWMYGTGRGVPQDYTEAYAWYSIAAANGQETARANRDIVAAKMGPTQIEKAQALSRELFSNNNPV